jgi:hypothetical protein
LFLTAQPETPKANATTGHGIRHTCTIRSDVRSAAANAPELQGSSQHGPLPFQFRAPGIGMAVQLVRLLLADGGQTSNIFNLLIKKIG